MYQINNPHPFLFNMTSITQQTTRSKGYTPIKSFKTILVDRSGSMGSFNGKQYDMAEHLLQDAKNQAVEKNQSSLVTFITFDDKVEVMLNDSDLLTTDVPPIHIIEGALTPRGCTHFNDTLIEQIDALMLKKETFLSSLHSDTRQLSPDVAMVLIAITDGEDNGSRATTDDAREKMLKFRKSGGRAILMTANMDAEVVGGWYGFNPQKSITVHNSNESAIETCYRAVSGMARNLTQGIDAPPFSALQRTQSSQVDYEGAQDNADHLMPPPFISRR